MRRLSPSTPLDEERNTNLRSAHADATAERSWSAAGGASPRARVRARAPLLVQGEIALHSTGATSTQRSLRSEDLRSAVSGRFPLKCKPDRVDVSVVTYDNSLRQRDDLTIASDAGFTLIELMVVLLILAILLAIAIPTFWV